jgi:AbrB family looped-hinge helix DNA binding protein
VVAWDLEALTRTKKPVKGLPGKGSRGVWCTMSYTVKTTHSTTLTLDAQGRVLLPRPLRKALGLEPGTRLLALVEDGRLVLIPWERAEEELWAELADLKESLAEELLRERQLEAERDG